MALPFFRIKEANAEITRLKTENETLAAQVASFAGVESENLAAVQAELADTKTKLDKADVDLAAANASLAKMAEKDAEIVALKEAATKLEASVEARASAKALAITQAQGQPAPVKGVATDAKPLTRAEFSALSVSAQAAHCRAGGKIIN
jgi:chromosome segregation ATPase